MDTIKALEELREQQVMHLQDLDRGRTRKGSEKARSKALYRRRIDALDVAISVLTSNPKAISA